MDLDFPVTQADRLVGELSEFLRIPSVSALPQHKGDCWRAAEWLCHEFHRLGFEVVRLIEGDGHPVVWAASPHQPGKPTLLCYGHYDVQPPDPLDEWLTPPFEPTVREGRLYGRGTADDKGQLYALIKAYEAVRGPDGLPPCNVHFLVEGEEECGGHVLPELLAREPHLVRADAALVADMSYWAPGWPAVYTALRGLCYAELHVRTLQRDLHSGTYGGVAPNALETLVRLLGDLKSRKGKIRIPKLYKRVVPPGDEELAGWAALPFDEQRFIGHEMTARAATGLADRTILERTWALPTFEIHGIMGGFTGAGAKTVIPATAAAKVSLRLVPGLPYELVLHMLERRAQKLVPSWAEVTVKPHHGGDPVQVAVDAPCFAVLDAAFEEVTGRKAVRVRAGGSIPIVPELGREGAPVMLTGIGLPDDGLHSPNEKLDLSQLHDGIRVFGRFMERFGEAPAATISD
ncbi:MAG: M20/M25/M40 family metallo-hydrolase [Gemmatimonadales bacterium]|nr:M20/M25/M40 family metallo-hydrolase [Gemmatimonadales bacterium]